MTLESRIINSGYKNLAVSCIIEYNKKLLLLKRDNNPHKGLYCPVGGKVEPFESPKEAVIREISEETGLKIKTFKMAGIMIETSQTKYNWVSIIYHSNLTKKAGLHQTDEGTLEWIPWSKLSEIPLPDTDMHIYNCLKNNQQFIFDVDYDTNGKIKSIENGLQ